MADIDRARIEAAVREILAAIGEDTGREGLALTPARVANAYSELFSGIGVDPATALGTPFPAETTDLIVVRDIRVRSVCEHHLLPFYGVAHVAYIPGDTVVGLSHIPHLVEVLAARPQVQENLTAQIVDTLEAAIAPRGAVAVLECTQSCVASRGGRQPDALTVTVASRGELAEPTRRLEVLVLLGADKSGQLPPSRFGGGSQIYGADIHNATTDSGGAK